MAIHITCNVIYLSQSAPYEKVIYTVGMLHRVTLLFMYVSFHTVGGGEGSIAIHNIGCAHIPMDDGTWLHESSEDKIQKHFQNVMLVGMTSQISKNYTYKCIDCSRHNGIKGACYNYMQNE